MQRYTTRGDSVRDAPGLGEYSQTPQFSKEVTLIIQPKTVYMVTWGVYDNYQVLAVFTESRGAQEFADHHNSTSERYSVDDRARVEEVDLYGPGWRRPPAEVLDGDLVNTTTATAATAIEGVS